VGAAGDGSSARTATGGGEVLLARGYPTGMGSCTRAAAGTRALPPDAAPCDLLPRWSVIYLFLSPSFSDSPNRFKSWSRVCAMEAATGEAVAAGGTPRCLSMST
jgi:hypothetical protein